MHVDEASGSQCPSNCLRIELVDSHGECRIITLPNECTVEQLKIMAVNAFHPDPMTCVKMFHQFKLILLSKRKQLREGRSLREEDVVDQEIVLLLPACQRQSFIPVMEEMQRDVNSRSVGPNDAEILTATSSLEFKNLNRPAKEQGNPDVSSRNP